MLHIARVTGRILCRCSSQTSQSTPRAAQAASWTLQNQLRRLEGRTSRPFTALARPQQEVAWTESISTPEDLPLVSSEHVKSNAQDPPTKLDVRTFPLACPGCGAPSQTVEPNEAGYYSPKKTSSKDHESAARNEEHETFRKALSHASSDALMEVLGHAALPAAPTRPNGTPICERCHNLLHHSRGHGIIHPSIHSIERIISESPHKHNHIYHVIDAADFPLSLIPNLTSALALPRLRTQNRRSKTLRYIRGRVAEVSFIITRSDLLAPKMEMVNALMPYLREVLRDALGRHSKGVRLGNARCVSSKRSWWTKDVKEEIWERGGAGWMVGKVNVGKSALFEAVFPKGRGEDVKHLKSAARRQSEELGAPVLDWPEVSRAATEDGDQAETATLNVSYSPGDPSEGFNAETTDPSPESEARLNIYQETELPWNPDGKAETDELFNDSDDASLLPPAQTETAYPSMPLVSSLPGTTASPIRIPFGNGRGELIDLPGIHRSSLSDHVQPKHHGELMMKSRIVPEQYVLMPGQSLLLGGMIRIAPKTDDHIFLAYPFVLLKPHVTAHNKAITIQTDIDPGTGETSALNVDNVATNEAKLTVKSAGVFKLEWDVTKRRTGPLTDPAAGKQKSANLPFVVYSADLLIEGVGWVELACQVRTRHSSLLTPGLAGEQRMVPEVEVFSPEGKFVGIRRPMNAWLLGGKRAPAKHARKARPRQSIDSRRRIEGSRARLAAEG